MRALSLAAVLAMLAGPVLAADQTAPSPGRTILHIGQQAEREVPQDRLRIELRAEVQGPDARTVQAEVNRRLAAALDHVRGNQAVAAVTGAYAVYRDGVGGQWRASAGLILTSADFAAAAAFAGDLQGQGLVIDDESFFVAPATVRAAEDELTDTALAALRERAEKIAADLGMRVDQIADVTVGNAGVPGPIRFRAAVAAATPVPPPPVQPGDSTITVNVDAVVVLVPK